MTTLYEKVLSNINIYHIDYKEFKHRVRWLYLGRIVTAVPCFVVYVSIALWIGFIPNIKGLAIILAFETFLNAPYDFIVKKFYRANKENLLVLIMLSLDVIAITLVIHFIGVQDSLFFGAMYLITITFAGILTSKHITYIIATIAAVCYGLLIYLEYSGIIPHISTIGIELTTKESFGWGLSHILFFYITAYLSNFYSSPLKLKEEELYLWGKTLEKRLKKSHIEAIRALLNALKVKDPYTENHSSNVAWYSTMIARKMNLSQKMINDIRDACLLHDIGKIGIQDTILNKNSELTPEEWEKMKLHPEFGSEIVAALSETENVSKMIIQEHEHYDGSGYPKGLKGNEICLGAQIVAVADAFDVIVTGRCYKKSIDPDKAVDIIVSSREEQFAPEVVDCFCEIYRETREDIHLFINRTKTKFQK